MGNAAKNIAQAKAAANSIAGIIRQVGIFEIFIFNHRAVGQDKDDSDWWNFVVDFSRPVSPREYFLFRDSLHAALGGRSKVHLTSPQYDRESYVASAMKTAVQIWSSR